MTSKSGTPPSSRNGLNSVDREDRLRDYAEAWGNLKELDGHAGWETYLDRLRYEYQQRQNRISAGRLSQEDYLRECGILEGMNLAAGVIERVKAEYENLMALDQDESLGYIEAEVEASPNGDQLVW